MRRKGHIVSRSRRPLPDSDNDEYLLFDESLPRYEIARNADTLIKLIEMNPYNQTILARMHQLDAPDCWLVSGCLFQTVWNVIDGRSPWADILDYDLIYFDPDQSREAEEAMQQRAGAVFQDLKVKIEIKNQARVHLWYKQKYHQDYPELSEACEALRHYPSRTQAIALQGRGGGRVAFEGPFGFENVLRQIVRPNPSLDLKHIYEAKIKRWQAVWSGLEVHPWP